MQDQKTELLQLLKLAIPVIITQIGNLSMGLVDTYVIGQVGAVELAGVAAGNSIFWPVCLIYTGLLLGMDTVVSQAFGNKDQDTIDRSLGFSLIITILGSLILSFGLYYGANYIYLTGASTEICAVAIPYLQTLSYGTAFLLLFSCIQKYWQALHIATPITVAVIIANLINYWLNLAFVHGHWGFPQLGATGVAYSTVSCRVFLLIAIIGISLWVWKKDPLRPKPKLKLLYAPGKDLCKRFMLLSLPAAAQIGIEIAAFNAASLIAARFGAINLAAHHIVLLLCSTTFMVPTGLAMATAIRVGSHFGQGHYTQAKRTGNLGIFLGGGIMAISSVILSVHPETFISIFSKDMQVVAVASSLILLGALFQITDGVQVVAAGALRGVGNNKPSLVHNAIGFYVIGYPLALFLIWKFEIDVKAIWIGLASGIIVAAILNARSWRKAYQAFGSSKNNSK